MPSTDGAEYNRAQFIQCGYKRIFQTERAGFRIGRLTSEQDVWYDGNRYYRFSRRTSEKCILRHEILVCKFQVQSVQFTACQSRTVTDVYERNDFRGRLYKMDGRDVRCYAGSLDKASRLYNANLLCAYGRFFHRHGE